MYEYLLNKLMKWEIFYSKVLGKQKINLITRSLFYLISLRVHEVMKKVHNPKYVKVRMESRPKCNVILNSTFNNTTPQFSVLLQKQYKLHKILQPICQLFQFKMQKKELFVVSLWWYWWLISWASPSKPSATLQTTFSPISTEYCHNCYLSMPTSHIILLITQGGPRTADEL